jgi:hypothetical protein
VQETLLDLCFLTTVNFERYVQAILRQFFPQLTEGERLYGWFQQRPIYCPHCTYVCAGFVQSSGTELSAVVFGQHVHLILILVIFSSRIV